MPRLNKASFKMKTFAKAYIENKGNKTKAAMEAYNPKSHQNAKRMGIEMTEHPLVQEEIRRLLNKSGLDLDTLADETRESLSAALQSKPTFAAGVNLLQFLYGLHGVSKVNKSMSVEWSNKQQIASTDITKLTETLTKLNETVTKLLSS